MFYVIGAEYKTTQFVSPVVGTEEKYGPFKTWQEAHDKWAERAWATVDSCYYRFTIKEELTDPIIGSQLGDRPRN